MARFVKHFALKCDSGYLQRNTTITLLFPDFLLLRHVISQTRAQQQHMPPFYGWYLSQTTLNMASKTRMVTSLNDQEKMCLFGASVWRQT